MNEKKFKREEGLGELKRCPRCSQLVPLESKKCDNCGLKDKGVLE